MLDQWNDADLNYLVHKRIDPHSDHLKMDKEPRMPEGSIIFEGGYVPPEEWEKAKVVFNAEMF